MMEKRAYGWAETDRECDEEEGEAGTLKGFFTCYLLCSLSPRHKGRTYIGFTVNPQRRIKQHNGEKRCGAWRTKRGRPWEMVLCIYGYPSNVSALQFEWAWQHPKKSLAVRKAASTFKSLTGVANKIKLAYTMLTLPSWEKLNLTMNFFSTKYMRYTAGCPPLPEQTRVKISPMDELPCYNTNLLDCNFLQEPEQEDDAEEYNVSFNKVLHAKEPRVIDVESSLSLSPRFDSNQTVTPETLGECRNASTNRTPSSCSEDSGMKLISGEGEGELTSDGFLLSPVEKGDLINLCTPSSSLLRTKTRRTLFDSKIIDLTHSPMVIQL